MLSAVSNRYDKENAFDFVAKRFLFSPCFLELGLKVKLGLLRLLNIP